MMTEKEEEMLRICIDIVETETDKDSRGYREAIQYIQNMVEKYLR
ncbi:hypothetical protein ABID30_002202 [Enterococcus rotai]|nr:hypothetical protein [Enterococcus rotai]